MPYIVPTIDLSNLDHNQKKGLYAILYRQECRAWLLFILLASGTLAASDSSLTKVQPWFAWSARIAAVIYSGYIAYWVVAPSQRLLNQLRESPAEKQNGIAASYDSSWASVRDFLPPLLVPVLLFLLLELGSVVWAN